MSDHVVRQISMYLDHGATSVLQAQVWLMRDQGDFSWRIIADTLNKEGFRRPGDLEPWTPFTLKALYGEPKWRLSDSLPKP